MLHTRVERTSEEEKQLVEAKQRMFVFDEIE